ncbi:MAG: TetR/AcrR family transcriptional regulator, partial [Alphaproteobacteria bacterium]
YRSVDRFVAESFEKLFSRLSDEGRISPDLDIPTLAKVFTVIGDGLFLRRAVDPDFDPTTVVPAVLDLIGKLMNVSAADRKAVSDKALELEPRQ